MKVLLSTLPAREQMILSLRFGIGATSEQTLEQVGIVLAQRPAPGTTLPQAGRVDLTVGRGRCR